MRIPMVRRRNAHLSPPSLCPLTSFADPSQDDIKVYCHPQMSRSCDYTMPLWSLPSRMALKRGLCYNPTKGSLMHFICHGSVAFYGSRWYDFVPNTVITQHTGQDSLLSSIHRRRLVIFGHIRRLPETQHSCMCTCMCANWLYLMFYVLSLNHHLWNRTLLYDTILINLLTYLLLQVALSSHAQAVHLTMEDHGGNLAGGHGTPGCDNSY